MLDQLNIEFAMWSDEVKLTTDQERKEKDIRDIDINVKHVYFQVGLQLVEKILRVESASTLRENKKQENEQAKNMQGANSLQLQQLQGGMDIDSDNQEKSQFPPIGQEHQHEQIQLSYLNHMQLVKSIFQLQKLECANEKGIEQIIQVVQSMIKRANELK